MKESRNAEKTVREDPLGFFNIHSVANLQKIEGGPLGGKKFSKKVAQCRTKIERNPLVSPGNVCYAENKEKPF